MAGHQVPPRYIQGEPCVKVELCEDKVTGYFDFNYYQWDAEAYEPSLDCPKYPWLRVRYAYNEEAADIDCMTFFASKDVEVLGTTVGAAIKTWDIANGEGEWMDTVVYIGDLIFEDGYEWNESTIRQFRVQMFEYNENPAAVCYIAGFGFFETEEAAKAYNFATGDAGVVTPPVVTEAPTTEAPTEAPTTEAPTEADTTVADTTVADTTEAATEADATVEDTTAAEDDTTAEEADSEDESADTEATEEATEATEAPTEADTTAAEEDETTAPVVEDAEDGSNMGLIIGIIAAVVVIAAVVIVVLKKKKA